jgi:hypothetical protein
MTNDLAELDIFYGELSVNRALIYARLPQPLDDAGLSLVGQVRGPRCLHAETLPMTASLVDLGPGPTLLARAVLPEPCFWSPDLPAIYDVTVKLQRGTQIVATVRREIGLRSLGVRGSHLAFEGKHWILRGVSMASTTVKLPREWHDASAALVLNDAAPQPLGEASQWGALAVVVIAEHGEKAVSRLRELTQHPAVAIAVVAGQLPEDFKKSAVVPNLLLAEPIENDGAAPPSAWADLLLVSADDTDSLSSLSNSSQQPILVQRPLSASLELPIARLTCDELQRDLASIGQFAGYIV